MSAPQATSATPSVATPQDTPEPVVDWITDAPPKPICDVPWLGGSIVLSTGDVNFCCFSGVFVGNVNERPFREIWNGPVMQRIRQSLIAGTLPPECRSGSCPIYRGDDRHYLLERMDGNNVEKLPDGEVRVVEKMRLARGQFGATRLTVPAEPLSLGATFALRLELACADPALTADLFVSIAAPEGGLAFLPGAVDFALPYGCELPCAGSALDIAVDTAEHEAFFATPGLYRVCAALFEPGSNPNLLANCYWAATKTFRLR